MKYKNKICQDKKIEINAVIFGIYLVNSYYNILLMSKDEKNQLKEKWENPINQTIGNKTQETISEQFNLSFGQIYMYPFEEKPSIVENIVPATHTKNCSPLSRPKYQKNVRSTERNIVPFEVKKWGYNGLLLPSYYFQPKPGIDGGQLRMTNISVYSTTPWKEANFISRAINNFYNGPNRLLKPKQDSRLVLTDATANIGGNTISFYLNGIDQVNAVEIDPLTSEILKHNLRVYKLPTDTVYCQNYLDVYQLLDQDIVFLDPPWGGPDYKKSNSIDLYLDGQSSSSKAHNIIDICATLMEQKKTTLIVLKLPINYNLPGLIARMPNRNFLTHKIYRKKHHSYNIIFCW